MTIPQTSAIHRGASALQTAGYLMLAGTLGLLVLLTFFSFPMYSLPPKLIFGAVLVLSVKRWTGAVLLVLVLLDLFVREPRRFGAFDAAGTMAGVVIVLAMLMFQSRYRTLRQLDGRSMLALVRDVFRSQEPASPTDDTVSEQILRRTVVSFAAGLGVILLSTVVALFVLGDQSLRHDPQRWLQESADGRLMLWPGPWLLTAIFAAVLLLSEFAWRHQTVTQSRLYARSVAMKLLYGDIRMVIKRRLKQRREKRPARETPHHSA